MLPRHCRTCGTCIPQSLCAFKNPALKGPICPQQQEPGPQSGVSSGRTRSRSPCVPLEAATDPVAFLKSAILSFSSSVKYVFIDA